MAQFMPTFEEQQDKSKKSIFGVFKKKPSTDNGQKISYTDNEEELEEKDVDKNLTSNNIYDFIVDRSGSMGGSKMNVTKESLKLFI